MKEWIIITIIISLVVIAGIVVSLTGSTTAEEPEEISCESCENSCTSGRNCGLPGCEAVYGGGCGCRG